MSFFVGFSLDYKDEAVESLLPFKDQLENPDHSVLYKTCSDLTKVNAEPLQNVRNVQLCPPKYADCQYCLLR